MKLINKIILFVGFVSSIGVAGAVENIIQAYSEVVPVSPGSGVISTYSVSINFDALYEQSGPISISSGLSSMVDFIPPDGPGSVRFEQGCDSINYRNQTFTHWSGSELNDAEVYMSLTHGKFKNPNGGILPTSDILVGAVFLRDYVYEFTMNSSGEQIMNKRDARHPFQCEVTNSGSSGFQIVPASQPLGTVIVDIASVYTDMAASEFGGAANIQTEIESAKNIANVAFCRSEVAIEYNLVAVSSIPNQSTNDPDGDFINLNNECEASSSECRFNRLTTNSFLTEFRDNNSADFVSIIQSNNVDSGQGIAQTPGVDPSCSSNFNQACYLQKVQANTLASQVVFAHELGHSFGLRHEDASVTAPIVDGARGFLLDSAITNGITPATIMVSGIGSGSFCILGAGGEPNCTRLLNFSNPDVDFMVDNNVFQTGEEGVFDAANGLTLSAETIAGYRTAGPPPPPPPPPGNPDAFEPDNDIGSAQVHLAINTTGVFEHNFFDNPTDWIIPSCGCGQHQASALQNFHIDNSSSGVNACHNFTGALDPNNLLEYAPVRIDVCNGSSVGEGTEYNVVFSCSCIEV